MDSLHSNHCMEGGIYWSEKVKLFLFYFNVLHIRTTLLFQTVMWCGMIGFRFRRHGASQGRSHFQYSGTLYCLFAMICCTKFYLDLPIILNAIFQASKAMMGKFHTCLAHWVLTLHDKHTHAFTCIL